MLDYVLLAAVALPSVVFAAGYIFAFNLPIWSKLGINLYQTQTLLVIAYVASSLPTNARVLVGAVSQLQSSLRDAALPSAT
jgi:iron(III) transport system permease protein